MEAGDRHQRRLLVVLVIVSGKPHNSRSVLIGPLTRDNRSFPGSV